MRCVVGNVVDPGLGARIGRRGIRFEPPFLLWWRYRGCRGHGGRRWIRYGRIRFNLIHQLIGSPPCSPRVILSQLLVAPFFDAFKQFFVGCVGVTELHAFEKAFNMNQRLRRTNSLIGPIPSDVLLLGIFLTTGHPLVDAEITLRLWRRIKALPLTRAERKVTGLLRRRHSKQANTPLPGCPSFRCSVELY